MFAVQADGYDITTIEGLAPAPGELSVIQDAFCETHGLQCGYCTPGMILSAHALLQHTDTPSREDIVEAISGNICRCTGYGQIIEAVQFAADRLRKANSPRAAAQTDTCLALAKWAPTPPPSASSRPTAGFARTAA